MTANNRTAHLIFTATACLFLCCISFSQGTRPKIGIALSGGGAKGLAHIGVLKAIDSAGLDVDYVTGTSMGAVVGGLYAYGYTGSEILDIARSIDWTKILSNRPGFAQCGLIDKDDYGRYLLELSLKNGRIHVSLGFLESNELWLILNSLFYPSHNNINFSSLPRQFECVAADVVTGERVDIKDGNLVEAIRASMAIPSIFTPVKRQGRLLVDGGIVRNFPVSNARELGADIVIGVDVTSGLAKEERLSNPVAILNQISFFRESSDLKKQRSEADLYIPLPVSRYNSGSFRAADSIVKIGIDEGMRIYPRFKALKDSLDSIYGPSAHRRGQRMDSVCIADVTLPSLSPAAAMALGDLRMLERNRNYAAHDVNRLVRRGFAAGFFSKATYVFEQNPQGGSNLIIQAEEMPKTALRTGVSYNGAVGIGLLMGIRYRSEKKYSVSSAAVSISENPRIEGSFMQYLGNTRIYFTGAQLKASTTNINLYDSNFSKVGLYRLSAVSAELYAMRSIGDNIAAGAATGYEWVNFSPEIKSGMLARGNIHLFQSGLCIRANTMDSGSYPKSGFSADVSALYVYAQDSNFDLQLPAGETAASLEDFGFRPYARAQVFFEHRIPLGSDAIFYQFKGGANFSYRQPLVNDYIIGGLNSVIRNQITFAGLPEGAIITSSAAVLQAGYQHCLASNLMLTVRANGLWHDFVAGNIQFQQHGFGMGYALTLGYNSILGPIDLSLMYSDFNKKVMPYLNIGIPLN